MIILGFLILKPKSSYELKKRMEESTDFFYSASFGSINPALKKMLDEGLVTEESQIDNGRNKIVYTVTKNGYEEYRKWLLSPIGITRIKDEALIRLFFLGFLSLNERKEVIKTYLDSLESIKHQLKIMYKENIKKLKEVPEEYRSIAQCQFLTLKYGVDFYDFEFNWFKNLLKDFEL